MFHTNLSSVLPRVHQYIRYTTNNVFVSHSTSYLRTPITNHHSTTTIIPIYRYLSTSSNITTTQSQPCMNWLLAIDSTNAKPSNYPIIINPGWHETCTIENTTKTSTVSPYNVQLDELPDEECIHIIMDTNPNFINSTEPPSSSSSTVLPSTTILIPQLMDIDIRTNNQPIKLLNKIEGNCYIQTIPLDNNNNNNNQEGKEEPIASTSSSEPYSSNVDILSTLRGTQIQIITTNSIPSSSSYTTNSRPSIINIQKVLEAGTGIITSNYLYARKLLGDTLYINLYNQAIGNIESIYCKKLILQQSINTTNIANSSLSRLYIGSLHGYGSITLQKETINTTTTNMSTTSSHPSVSTGIPVLPNSVAHPIMIQQITGSLDYNDDFPISSSSSFSSIHIQYDSPRDKSTINSYNSIECVFLASTNTLTKETSKSIENILRMNHIPFITTATVLSAVRIIAQSNDIQIPDISYDNNKNIISSFYSTSSIRTKNTTTKEGILILYNTSTLMDVASVDKKITNNNKNNNEEVITSKIGGSGKIRDTIPITGWYMNTSASPTDSATTSPSISKNTTESLDTLPVIQLTSKQSIKLITYSWYDNIRKKINST